MRHVLVHVAVLWFFLITAMLPSLAQSAPPSPSRPSVETAHAFITGHKIPVGQVTKTGFDWFKTQFAAVFNLIRIMLDASLKTTQYVLLFPPPLVFIAILGCLSYFFKRDWKNLLLTVLGFSFVLNQGYWKDAMETLSLLLWSFMFCLGFGVPIGIYCAHHPRIYRLVQPVLDMMQVVPSFVYLLPGMALFRIGMVPGLLATVIFVIPIAIRLTAQGIAATPKTLLEAGDAFGASKRQRLWKVELPFAMGHIRTAMTQTIMLSLSMVVIAAAVGANGLGIKVYTALQRNNVALGFESGLVIVVVAVVLDRLFRPKMEKHIP